MTDAPNTDDPDDADNDAADVPNANNNDAGSTDSKNTNIHWENAINISNSPPTPKKTEKYENWR